MEIIIILVVIFVILMLLYNTLVSKKNSVEKSLSTIDTYLQKRFDLMESLFAQVERALNHELESYSAITKNRTGFDELRKSYNDKKSDPVAIVQADRAISSMFNGMRNTTEAYPELQALDTVNTVIDQNITIENELNSSRRQYNSNVTVYRNSIQSFPAVLLANMFGFKDIYELYKADEQAQQRPKPKYENYYKNKYDQKDQSQNDKQ